MCKYSESARFEKIGEFDTQSVSVTQAAVVVVVGGEAA